MHLPQFHLAYITHHTYMLNAGQWLYMRLSEQTVELSIAMENVSDIFEVYSTVEQLATQSHATFVEGPSQYLLLRQHWQVWLNLCQAWLNLCQAVPLLRVESSRHACLCPWKSLVVVRF